MKSMMKKAFTLAEVILVLLVLGVIAALTIPSLVQNSYRKEQITQAMKGFSMLNQAVRIHYTMEDQNIKDLITVGYNNEVGESAFTEMIRDRLKIERYSKGVSIYTNEGLTYFVANANNNCSDNIYATDDDGHITEHVDPAKACLSIVIATVPEATYKFAHAAKGEQPAQAADATSDINNVNGYFQFYADPIRIVPSNETAILITQGKI